MNLRMFYLKRSLNKGVIFILLLFFIGIILFINFINHNNNHIKAKEKYQTFMNLMNEEKVDLIPGNISSLNCVDENINYKKSTCIELIYFKKNENFNAKDIINSICNFRYDCEKLGIKYIVIKGYEAKNNYQGRLTPIAVNQKDVYLVERNFYDVKERKWN